MNNKYFKLIITFALALCFFCTSVTVFATTEPSTEETVVGNNPGGLIPEGSDDSQDTSKEEETTTQKVIINEVLTEPTTVEDDNTTTTKKKPSSTTTTRRNTGSSSNTTRRSETTKTTETSETTLPEGQFYVHLVLGNGKPNQKTIMKEPGKVTAPAEPTREGYVFEGWYSDAKFTKPWDFAKDEAKEEMTIYAKWSVDVASVLYTITVSDVTGGKITVEPSSASVGTPVVVSVKPDEGKRLVEGSLTINGKKTAILTFDMPAENVVIKAQFEDIPAEVETAEEKDNTVVFVLIGAGVLVVALIVVGVIMIKRKNEIVVPEFDENGAVIIDDDDDVWVDESLVIEDAFPTVRNKPVADTVAEPVAENDIAEVDETAPAEKTKRLTEIVNGDEPSAVDNDAKLTQTIKEGTEKSKLDVSKIDFSLFE